MTGEELYLIYAEHLLEEHNTGVDMWHDLSRADQLAWEAVAVAATAVPERATGTSVAASVIN
jgi:hypothetical protein